MSYTFCPTPYEPDLALELAGAFKARTEHISRGAMPGVWRITDSLRRVGTAQRKESKWLPWALLVMGAFLLCAGIRDPHELLIPMLVGLLAVLYALRRILGARRSRRNGSFLLAAERMLRALRAAEPSGDMRVVFDDAGMTVSAQGSTRSVPYGDFELLVETPRLYLLTYQQQATVLQKKDLLEGDGGFPSFFTGKTGKSAVIAEGDEK